MIGNKEELDRDTNARERAAYLRGDVKDKTKEELYAELVETIKEYNLEDELGIVEKAYRLADEAHKEQKRKSGEPYIIHPISVAIILTKLEMDIDTIIAGLLHDVIEDTDMEYEDVAREFSEDVAVLVDGVTKLTQLNYSSDKV